MGYRRIAVALLLTAVAVAACADDGGDSGIEIGEPIGAPGPGSDYASDTNGDTTRQPVASAPIDTGPSVIKNAAVEIDVVATELNSAAQEVVDLTTSTKIGGFLVSSLVDTNEGDGSAAIVVKVPAPRFEQVVGELGRVGDVTRQQLAGQDLTADYLTTHARLQSTQDRMNDLLRRLEDSEDPTVRSELRQDLRSVTEEIRGLQANEAYIATNTSFSMIEVALTGTPPPGPPEKPAFERALNTAKDISLAIASGIVLAAGVIVPIGLLLFLIYVAAGPAVRRIKPRLKTDPF